MRSGNLKKLFDLYERPLATSEAREQLDELIAIVNSGWLVCLLCYARRRALASKADRQEV